MSENTLEFRRKTHAVKVAWGGRVVTIGGMNPIVVQSMTNTSTADVESSVAQVLALARAGSELVRLTVNTPDAARGVARIREALDRSGCDVPLVGDFHYNGHKLLADLPECAAALSQYRINPGNVGKGEKGMENFASMIECAKKYGAAVRIGVNWGSLDQALLARMMDENNALSDPLPPDAVLRAALVESAVQSADMAVKLGLPADRIVLSAKVSEVQGLISVYRMLARRGSYALHLGLTEAGIGSKGIVASTAALAVLLQEGIGDTIRVSLTEAPENEIPVAQLLVEHFADRPGEFEVLHPERYTPTEYRRRSKVTVPVVHTEPLEGFRVLEALSGNPTAELRAAILNLDIPDEPVVVKRRYEERSLETLAVKAAADLGPLLLDGLADGIWIDAPGFAESEIRDIELMILQAARVRFSHTEYIACPSCGRTLYDIEKALADIKARTSHLKNLRIGVMGCIVNGPGEMADADYGYVGAGPGRITLYKGRTVVERNIPQEEALDRLVELIKKNGDWTPA